MSSTTRVGAAQDALLVLLKANSTLSPLSIALGAPNRTLLAEELWITGDIKNWQDAPDMTYVNNSAQVREETFTIPVNLVVTQSTNDYPTVRNRALTLIAAVETVIANNPTISGTVLQANIAGKELSDGVADEKRQIVGSLQVECLAMLA